MYAILYLEQRLCSRYGIFKTKLSKLSFSMDQYSPAVLDCIVWTRLRNLSYCQFLFPTARTTIVHTQIVTLYLLSKGR